MYFRLSSLRNKCFINLTIKCAGQKMNVKLLHWIYLLLIIMTMIIGSCLHLSVKSRIIPENILQVRPIDEIIKQITLNITKTNGPINNL